ncbi:uncharacterized protein FIBRA_05318 [Fibroporia radiculosa]|uniref:Uncharacterized protein n=1 Tax=Fibroporia radiculosa TaxID=599839 RepID=J4H3F7_9APHY|nr:uncharacterized protein FIBRA_05318 [Fibroporia radiculosa]CCM03194.1 predicted protein [Fibroporia radiculosa]
MLSRWSYKSLGAALPPLRSIQARTPLLAVMSCSPDLLSNWVVATTCYMIFAAEFMLRVLYDRPISRRLASPTSPAIYGLDRNIWQILSALIFSNLCVHVRLWYRIIELSDNSTGYLSRTQRYFVIMDALMIILAMLTVNLFHPGRLLARPGAQKGDVWKVDMILSSEENVSSLACIELASA